jgi:hypothetical protein
MKKLFFILYFLTFSIFCAYSQDSVSYITSDCLGSTKSVADSPCPDGINFNYQGDSLEIFGKVVTNCCGTHLMCISKITDTILITTIDTGQLCFCNCIFCFDIKIKVSVTDTIVSFNGLIYNTKSSDIIDHKKLSANLIKVYPNPTDGNLSFEVVSGCRINNIIVTNILGKEVVRVEDNTNELSLREMPAGIYFINFNINDNQTVIKKMIKK